MANEFEPGRLIWDQLVLLNNSWHTYKVLYQGPEDIGVLLDRSARWFFGSHRRLLIRDIVLAISRLTDSESIGKNRNLVLATILQDPALEKRPETRERLRADIDSIVAAAEPLRRHRHKYIAHLDHEVALGKTPPPPPVPWQTIEDIIARGQAIYHEYALLCGSGVSFELAALGDVNHLLEKLEDAQKWRRYYVHTLRTRGRPPDDPETAA